MKFKNLIAATALTLTVACATPATGPAAQDRFDSFSFAAGKVDLSTYELIHVAPVTVSEDVMKLVGYRPIGPSDTKRPLSERDISSKAKDLEEDLIAALKDVSTLVDASGPGILTVEAVITKLEANRPTQADMAAEPGLRLQSIYSGAAAVEITFSEDNVALATAKDADSPTLNDTLPPSPVWSTVDRFFGRLADKVAGLLS